MKLFAQPADPLPSGNAGKTKQSIVTFVSKVTERGSSETVSTKHWPRAGR